MTSRINAEAATKVGLDRSPTSDPDFVYTVDYCKGLSVGGDSSHIVSMSGDLVRYDHDKYINIVNRLTATPRWLESYVLRRAFDILEVPNVITQPEGVQFEGGDIALFKTDESGHRMLVLGNGQDSRSNDAGRNWVRDLLRADHELTITSEQFHRDLVSVFVRNRGGIIVQALLAEDRITNIEEVREKLVALGIPIVTIPNDAPGDPSGLLHTCSLNLAVAPGQLVGMQSHPKLTEILREKLLEGVTYRVVPNHLQSFVAPFVDTQGGANCVSGNIVLPRDCDIDLSPGRIAEVNEDLHGSDCEEYLQSVAEGLDMVRRIGERMVAEEPVQTNNYPLSKVQK